MKILLANKFYYRRGGDCIYVLNLEQLLKDKGHEVAVFSMDYSENINSKFQEYFPSEISFSIPGNKNLKESFLRSFGTKEVASKFSRLLSDFKPDVVHLNNIHTQLSPIIAKIAHERGVKVVWTLHDYKLLCPRYDCLRNDAQVCELCFTDKTQVIKHRCMKNSVLASTIAYLEAIKWTKNKLESYTNYFICPSRFMYDKMLQGGFRSAKLINLSNFIDVKRSNKTDYSKSDYYCYIGRLSHEKGVETLIRAAADLPYKLLVIGDGPLAADLKKLAEGSNVEFLGYKPWDEIKQIVGKARFSVVPSEWYENNPLSVIETLCLGTPVLGANIGGIPELIMQDENGCLFNSGDILDLRAKIQYCWGVLISKIDPAQIALEAQQKFTAEIYYQKLLEIYKA